MNSNKYSKITSDPAKSLCATVRSETWTASTLRRHVSQQPSRSDASTAGRQAVRSGRFTVGRGNRSRRQTPQLLVAKPAHLLQICVFLSYSITVPSLGAPPLWLRPSRLFWTRSVNEISQVDIITYLRVTDSVSTVHTTQWHTAHLRSYLNQYNDIPIYRV